ncbi:hypothetical protein CSB08_01175 [Candidatus Gracilibacteria bacterium]|nr:MAG: hypothetical protein CSB08_01175 [Candidatus Gracilibacteria bacterium]PIE85582.1 MAG: hypothetical protein CSA08_01250 [Candidatus Gracilibacteria bacterium]
MNSQVDTPDVYKTALDYVKENKNNLSNSSVKNKIKELFKELNSEQKRRLVEQLNSTFDSSKQEIKNLVRDMYNLGNNFPSNITQEDVIKIALAKLDNFDKDTIKSYQKSNGLKVDGVLGYDTYKHMLNSSKVEKKSDSLFSKESLDKIGVTTNEAKKLANEVLEKEITKEEIISFQETHRLGIINGEIGKETYVQLVLNQASKGIEKPNVGLSQDSMDRIMSILEKGDKSDKDVIKVMSFLKQFKKEKKELIEKDEKHKEFFGKTNKIEEEYKKSPEGKKALKDAKKHYDSIYGTIKKIGTGEISMKDGVEKIIKDPTLLLAGGILFLFGVFGSGSKYTNSFMKRAGWIFGGMVFGPAIWKKIGVSEIIDDAENGISHLGESFSEAKKSESYRKAKDKLSNIASNPGKLFDGLGASISAFFSNSKNTVENFFESTLDDSLKKVIEYNQTLHDDRKVSQEVLGDLTSTVLSDKKFLNLEKSDLKKITSVDDLVSNLEKTDNLTREYKKPDGTTIKLKDSDIKNFMQNHMQELLGDKKYVRYLFITERLKKAANEAFNFGDYNKNPQINEIIKADMSTLHADNPKIADELAGYIRTGRVKAFVTSNLKGDVKTQVESITEKVKYIEDKQKLFSDSIKEVRAIKVENTNSYTFNEAAMNKSIEKLDSISSGLNSKLGTEEHSITFALLGKTSFDNAVAEKRKDIYELASDNGVGAATDELKKAEEELVLTRELKEITKTSLEVGKNFPKANYSLEKFKKYLEKNGKYFRRAEALKTKYENEEVGTKEGVIRDKAVEVLGYKEDFKVNLEARISILNNEFETIKKEVNKNILGANFKEGGSVTDTQFLTEIKRLSGLQEDFNKIEAFDEIKNFQVLLTKVGIDEKILNGTTKNNTESAFKTRLNIVKSCFDVNIDTSKITVDNVNNIIDEVNKKELIIKEIKGGKVSFLGHNFEIPNIFLEEDLTLNEKEKSLERIKSKIIRLFEKEIEEAKTEVDVIELRDKFENTGLESDSIDEKVKNKLEKIYKGKILEMKIADNEKVFELYNDFKVKNMGSMNSALDEIGVNINDIDTIGEIYEFCDMVEVSNLSNDFKTKISNFRAKLDNQLYGDFENAFNLGWVETKNFFKKIFNIK